MVVRLEGIALSMPRRRAWIARYAHSTFAEATAASLQGRFVGDKMQERIARRRDFVALIA